MTVCLLDIVGGIWIFAGNSWWCLFLGDEGDGLRTHQFDMLVPVGDE